MQRSGPHLTQSTASQHTRSSDREHFIPSVLRRPGGYGEAIDTRSHPELGRENPQRRWYCVLRRGRVGRRQVFPEQITTQTARSNAFLSPCRTTKPHNAGWSSPVARQAHNLKVIGSNPIPATILICCDSPATDWWPGFLLSASHRPKMPAGRLTLDLDVLLAFDGYQPALIDEGADGVVVPEAERRPSP